MTHSFTAEEAAALESGRKEEFEKRKYEFKSNCEEQGNPSACHSLGDWLATVDRDYAAALRVFQRNCEAAGETKEGSASCFNAARILLGGGDDDGVGGGAGDASGGGGALRDASASSDPSLSAATCARRDAQAVGMLRRSCDAQHIQACHHLAIMTLRGSGGLERDPAGAMKLFERSCANENMHSCHVLGTAFLRPPTTERPDALSGVDDGVASTPTSRSKSLPSTSDAPLFPRDPGAAVPLLERACKKGHPRSCYNLAVLFKNGDEGVPADEQKFRRFAKRTQELVVQSGATHGVKIA